MTDVQNQNPIIDSIGAVPIVVAVAEDGYSVRAFRRIIDTGPTFEMFAKATASPITFIDSASGSEWDFRGLAIRGPLQGRQLARVEVLRDYWFDWRTYHPETEIFHAGLR
jgi:hypothetical protein